MRSGQVAQSVEQGTENPRVGGSIPSLGTTKGASKGETTVSPFVVLGSRLGVSLHPVSVCASVRVSVFESYDNAPPLR